MDFSRRFISCAFAAWLGVALSGCAPSEQSQSDEEKEPHFVLGKTCVNAMDYQGAVEAFEESLEANPRSAAAHFELGWLYDEKESDPAAAIYHYQQYLKLNPKAENADVIVHRIDSCKQQLAADVMPLPSAPAVEAQLEKLTEQNRQLQDEVDKWRAYYLNQQTAKTNPPDNSVTEQIPNPIPTQFVTANTNRPAKFMASNIKPRTHAVAAGETEAAIARKFGIKLSALQAANPGVNPNKLRVGQILNLPPS